MGGGGYSLAKVYGDVLQEKVSFLQQILDMGPTLQELQITKTNKQNKNI